MTTTTLIAEIRTSTDELLDAISLFTHEQLNQVPFAGSWTPGQVAQHLLKSESGIPQLFEGNTAPANREPDALVPVIHSIFLDFTTKMQSPDFILPDEEPKNSEALRQQLKQNREHILQLISTRDLTRHLTDFAFPELGELTGYEWMKFMISHAKRHTHQMKNMLPHFNSVSK